VTNAGQHTGGVWRERLDHRCSVGASDADRRRVLARFAQDGLARGEAVVAVGDAPVRRALIDDLRAAGIDAAMLVQSGQLTLLGPEQWYPVDGAVLDPFAQGAQLSQWAARVRETNAGGCFVADMSWAAAHPERFGDLLEYEARLNDYLLDAGVRVLCHYDRRAFASAQVLDMLATHPIVAVGGDAVSNPSYVPPAAFFDAARADRVLDVRLATLSERHRQDVELTAYDHSVSHDLKGPLASILTAAEWLLERGTGAGAAELREELERIAAAAQRANETVESLLLLAEPHGVDVVPLDMGAIVDAAIGGLAGPIRELLADVVQPADWPAALGHPALVRHVWVNYVGNALKHGGRSVRVELGATVAAAGRVRFWVRDNGPGIPAAQRAALFAPRDGA